MVGNRPEWFEAVLSPEEGTGVKIRIAEIHRDTATPITPVPDDVAVPPARIKHAAHLDWIGHDAYSSEGADRKKFRLRHLHFVYVEHLGPAVLISVGISLGTEHRRQVVLRQPAT